MQRVGVPYGARQLTRIGGARFRRIVGPGETVATRVQVTGRTGPAFECRGDVRCEGERVLRVEFVITSTGGLAALFAESTDIIDHTDRELTIRGLLEVYNRNAGA